MEPKGGGPSRTRQLLFRPRSRKRATLRHRRRSLSPGLPSWRWRQGCLTCNPARRGSRRSRAGLRKGAVAVGVVGIIGAGTLGYFLYATTGQRDAALRYAASTQATLTTTQGTLATTQQTLEAGNETAAYTRMVVVDSGRVRTDYQKIIACSSFGSCRTAAQSALTDMQAFQADRAAAAAPTALASSDGMLRDALSAAIAADREIISGMDSGNVNKFLDGLHKLNAAMLSMAKAEAALGAELK